MLPTRQSATLKALGIIEGFKNDLNMLSSTLADLPLWLPSTALTKQCDEAIRMIDDIAERFERKLVVTIVGPCGAGKSTLLNAFAGIDDLSPAGGMPDSWSQTSVVIPWRLSQARLPRYWSTSSSSTRRTPIVWPTANTLRSYAKPLRAPICSSVCLILRTPKEKTMLTSWPRLSGNLMVNHW